MDAESSPPNPLNIAWRIARVWLIGMAFVAAIAAILILPISPTGKVALEVGDVAPRDIRSPIRITFESNLLTEEERQRVEATVAPIFTPPDGRVVRQQIAYTRAVADFIRAVRADSYATSAQKQAALGAIDGISVSLTQAERTITLRDEAWAKVEAETLNVLDLALRGELREGNVAQLRARIPAMVSVDLTEAQAALVAALAQQFIAPNSFLDSDATATARAKAGQAVKPIQRSFEAGEIIVREGQSVTPLDIEALDELDLRQSKDNWNDLIGAGLYALVVVAIVGAYLRRFETSIWHNLRKLTLLGVLILLFILAARFTIPGRTALPYLFPTAALTMLLTVLAGPNLAVLVAAMLGTTAAMLGNRSFELGVYATAGGIAAALALARVERLNAFFRAGLYVALVNVLIVLAFRLPPGATDPIGFLTLVLTGIANGGISASLAVGGLFLIGNLFDVTTTLQLLELAQPTHPLLQLLLRKAPGTYHHTLMVANLAEQAAERIRADALLVRVGAFYHDVGKTTRPYMFVENQVEGSNVHEKLDARTSAEIITRHVQDGLELAKRYRLPSRVSAFIPEHHGTMRAGFLYQKAVQQAGGDPSKVNEQVFRYPGPKPQSKETALLMLADGCEAAVRAMHPSSVEEISEIVRKVITERVACGQLDECPLTMHDLDLLRQSFTMTLQGMFHPRIQYPEMEGARSVERQTETS
jgi:putative nucleotidyltransferase with HDIG domain